MFWRLILVVSIIVLLIGVTMYFSDQLFATFQQAWSLEKDEREKLKDWRELLAGGFAGLGGLGLFMLAVARFIAGKKQDKTEISEKGNRALFHEEVHVKGDFVQGNKIFNRGDDV